MFVLWHKCDYIKLVNIIRKMIKLTFILLLLEFCLNSCPSEGVDYSDSLITNGDFQDPVIGAGNPPQIFPGGVGDWRTSLAQIGNGVDYNTLWTSQVAALDTGVNQAYTQSFNISTGGALLFFSLDFARQMGSDPSSNGIRVYWNGRNVANYPTSNDDSIYQIVLNLTTISGVNTVRIEALGHDDGTGTEMDNVGIYPYIQYNREMINGVCSCVDGYFDNGHDYNCVGCGEMMAYCVKCSFIPDLSLLPPECLANIYKGLNCSFGAFTCSQCQSGYFLANDGTCQPIQIDPQFYEPDWNLQYVSCNKFTANIYLQLPSFSYLFNITTNNTNVIVNNQILDKDSSAPESYKISLQCSYTQGIADETISFIVYFQNSLNLVQTAASTIVMKSSNIPLAFYTQNQCSQAQNIEGFATTIAILSYFVLFFSLISLKIIGLELFGVLQLAFIDLSTQDRVNLYLKPLLKWKYINGLNIETTQTFQNVPTSVYLMGYKDNFLFNFNFMFAVLVLNLIIGGILYCAGSRMLNKRIIKLSLYLLKLVFITLFLFNSINLSFCIGLHFKYSNASTQFQGLGTFGALMGIGLYIFPVIYMQIVKPNEFGEYKNKFKVNCITKFYIPLSIIYRFILGLYIAAQNQWFLGTLIIIGFNIAFIMYNVVNLPFKRPYQNYRANFCHFIQLIILLVSNYYRSMKYNLDTNERARIFWPAILQLVFIFFCCLGSMGCLIYEIVTAIRSYLSKRKTKETKEGQSESKIIKNANGLSQEQNTNNELTNNNNSNANNILYQNNLTDQEINVDNA